ncbi:hypothetical protein [Nesterenkonia jeotgali]|uniref:Zinc-finger domain-containing protein n=1 Tax=Nesterenkonia jeotgali TaxID=317018 RepID=A0A0W8IHB3_9MICC|nr:hypothetical protein [Nesterenkonia jeotgali]KUG59088.1 hypothetical protein AVL63_03570 [Nesterenkonia jeotgali]
MSAHHDDTDPMGGPDPASQRRAELLGAAAADDLSPAERQELDAMCAEDPMLAQELRELREISAALPGSLDAWSQAQPPESLRERVIAEVTARESQRDGAGRAPAQPDRNAASQGAAASPAAAPQGAEHAAASPAAAPQGAEPDDAEPGFAKRRDAERQHTAQHPQEQSAQPTPQPTRPGAHGAAASSRRRSRLRQSLALAACVALGVAGTLGVQAILDTDSDAQDPDEAGGLVAEEPLGPPGELGSQEPVSFTDPSAGVVVDGSLIAHTWGTETVLLIDGLPVGEAFTVVLIGEDGQEIESGSFLGSEVPVDCRMNGAVLREDVQRLEIRDETGGEVTAAALPDVE